MTTTSTIVCKAAYFCCPRTSDSTIFSWPRLFSGRTRANKSWSLTSVSLTALCEYTGAQVTADTSSADELDEPTSNDSDDMGLVIRTEADLHAVALAAAAALLPRHRLKAMVRPPHAPTVIMTMHHDPSTISPARVTQTSPPPLHLAQDASHIDFVDAFYNLQTPPHQWLVKAMNCTSYNYSPVSFPWAILSQPYFDVSSSSNLTATRGSHVAAAMDIMMVLSTEDVKRLKTKFVRPLSVDEFVYIMMKCLHEHIHDEVEFVVSVIELYETIDVNGDGLLEWDEFAGYIVDAGIAKAEEAIVAQATIKLYSPLVFKGEAANTIQPIASDASSYIEQLLILAGRQALAYFDHGSDVVHVYLFGHERDAEPRFASTIRLHTAYQAHRVLCIEDIAGRAALAVSSVLHVGCVTLWDLARLYSPIPLQRVELAVAQETLAWAPALQLLITTTTQSTYKKEKTAPHHHHSFVGALDIATLARVPVDVNVKHISCVCVMRRSTRTSLVLGSLDGTITAHDMAKESQHPQRDVVVDAHEKGVKALVFSPKFGYLASIGHYSFAEESTMEVLVWHLDETAGHLEHALCGHHAALCAITAVDSESHLLSSDELGMFRVWSVSTWDCLQVFHTAHISLLRSQIVWPATAQADALLLCAGKTVEFHDCSLAREREEFLFMDFNATFNVIIAVTYHRLVLWDFVTGDETKMYELHVVYNGRPVQAITAVCLDDRERKLIVGDDIGQILVVNLVNGNLMKELDPHAQAITSLSYAAKSKCVISTAMDSSIHICDENNAHGYYVPIAGAPLSVLLRSLHFTTQTVAPTFLTATAATSSTRHRRGSSMRAASIASTGFGNNTVDIVSGVVSDALGLIATVAYCPGGVGESYVQLWAFETSQLVATCIAPDPSAEISCVAFLGNYAGIVAGLSSGHVFVWGVWQSTAPFQCLFELSHDFDLNSISSLLAVHDTTANGVVVFAGDDTGRVMRWSLDHTLCHDQGLRVAHDEYPLAQPNDDDDGDIHPEDVYDAQPSTRPSTTSSRHTHTDVVWDTVAKSVRSAKLLRAAAAPPIVVKCAASWQVESAVTKLAKAECTPTEWSLLTCVQSGKIEAWSVDGVAQGALDYFATRRHPVHEPWRLPVDVTLRQRKQEARAKKVLQQLQGVSVLLRDMDLSKVTSKPTSTNSTRTTNAATSQRSNDLDVLTPRTGARFQTLSQLVAQKERRAAVDDESANVPLDVVLHDIGKLNQVSLNRHAVPRKKRAMKTVEGILETSMSAPTLRVIPRSKSKAKLKPGYVDKHILLPPIDMRHEMAPPTLKSTAEDNVLSYHMKLAHAWQQ
ncbi:Aste57867_8219 [Aphanomyces stellatus]|uniref:Aste57867_8219 protein n=1 Tax=Aphanomyces stellatus TaxID=120398 RepID=A0A485KJQ3_9STRA|nr:hypothetical protein As57867_008188 [Aphanomyces stellatus]VFT85106.1 Aste57867_8219 [Aphanomyces stellatus]